MADRNVDAVIERLQQRAEKGLETYGVTTEREDLSPTQWLQHAQDEALDLAVYLERLRGDTYRSTNALYGLVEVIEAAGLHNLSNGVQIGPTAWYVKASDAMQAAYDALGIPEDRRKS